MSAIPGVRTFQITTFAVLLAVLPAVAADPGPRPDLPAGVPADWWSEVQRSIQLEEYGVVSEGADGTELRATNPAHRSRIDISSNAARSTVCSLWWIQPRDRQSCARMVLWNTHGMAGKLAPTTNPVRRLILLPRLRPTRTTSRSRAEPSRAAAATPTGRAWRALILNREVPGRFFPGALEHELPIQAQ